MTQSWIVPSPICHGPGPGDVRYRHPWHQQRHADRVVAYLCPACGQVVDLRTKKVTSG